MNSKHTKEEKKRTPETKLCQSYARNEIFMGFLGRYENGFFFHNLRFPFNLAHAPHSFYQILGSFVEHYITKVPYTQCFTRQFHFERVLQSSL